MKPFLTKLCSASFPIVALLAAALCLTHIHQGTLAIDGLRYAHISKHIVDTGDWWRLWDEFRSEPYANKPPFLFWLVAALFHHFGFSTFVAKLPGACFALLAVLLIWRATLRLFGERAALWAVILFVSQPNFFRAVVDLNFEAILLCAGLCCLWGLWEWIDTQGSPRQGAALFAWGVLLVTMAKPPYLAVLAFPTAAALFLLPRERRSPSLILFFLPALIAMGSGLCWYLFQDTSYLGQAMQNQVSRPLSLSKSLAQNLASWLRSFLLYSAPASLLALLAATRALPNARRDPRLFLLLAWFAPVVPIMLLLDCRGPYLLLPLLGGILLGAHFITQHLPRPSSQTLRGILLVVAVIMVLLPAVGLRLHRNDPLLDQFFLQPALQKAAVTTCIDGGKQVDDLAARRRALLLYDLYLGSRFPVLTSETLSLQAGDLLVAESKCRDHLIAEKRPLLEQRHTSVSSLFRAATNFSAQKSTDSLKTLKDVNPIDFH